MAEKTGRNSDNDRRSNFRLKLNAHVWYNNKKKISEGIIQTP